MTRVKRSVTTRRRHNRKLKQTKGYRGLRSSIFTQANIAWMKAGLRSYVSRKLKKRDFRVLWIARISAALKQINPKYQYSRFIASATKKNIGVNRKILADLAFSHGKVFEVVVDEIMVKG